MNTFDISVQRFDEFANEYAERFRNTNSYLQYFEKFCDSIESQKPKILELACGPGNVTRYLKQRFPNSQIVAIDLAPGMIDIARKAVGDVDFRLLDVRDMHSIDMQFDSIMCSFCLPFLSRTDTDKLISDCAEKLTVGGVFYISTMEGDESKAGFESTSFSGDSKVYFNYHRQKDLEDSLVKNGFSIEYNIRQDYLESDGRISVDLIMIAKKN